MLREAPSSLDVEKSPRQVEKKVDQDRERVRLKIRKFLQTSFATFVETKVLNFVDHPIRGTQTLLRLLECSDDGLEPLA